jgi:hypothetical protein
MRVSCNRCDWVATFESAEDIPEECPTCDSTELTIGNEVVVPEEARAEEGAEGVVDAVSVFPDEYPAPTEYSESPYDMEGEECLRQLVDMQVDFDHVNHRFIPTAIILPRPIWICGIKLVYNASCRPERNWTPETPGTPPDPPEAQGPIPDNPYEPIPIVRDHRRGRLIDANAALAIARFFRYIHDEFGVVQVDHAGIWPGRATADNPHRNHAHGWGKAIDFCFFYVVQGDNFDSAGFYGRPRQGIERGNVCRDWGPLLETPTTPKERFMRHMDTELRRHWQLVLGPDDTANHVGSGDHTTHFHVDTHHYGTPA